MKQIHIVVLCLSSARSETSLLKLDVAIKLIHIYMLMQPGVICFVPQMLFNQPQVEAKSVIYAVWVKSGCRSLLPSGDQIPQQHR